jgi:hypothetical protein
MRMFKRPHALDRDFQQIRPIWPHRSFVSGDRRYQYEVRDGWALQPNASMSSIRAEVRRLRWTDGRKASQERCRFGFRMVHQQASPTSPRRPDFRAGLGTYRTFNG